MLPIQCRMGRAALDISVGELSEKTGVSVNTITRFEKGDVDLKNENLEEIRAVLESEGVSFSKDKDDRPCVCLVKPKAKFTKRPPRWQSLNMVVTFEIDTGYRMLTVVVPRNVMNDRDSKNPHAGTEAEILESFKRLQLKLLNGCQKVLETKPGRVQPDGRLYLLHEDIP